MTALKSKKVLLLAVVATIAGLVTGSAPSSARQEANAGKVPKILIRGRNKNVSEKNLLPFEAFTTASYALLFNTRNILKTLAKTFNLK
ncbi:MAG: hypothetical protein IIB56_06595 [Planctomycetes bacterium]|nr:hypothetical protein [Planctomycetota bacterium]MCH8119859.1 hypothetical protein [Planctomycetota bacterium]